MQTTLTSEATCRGEQDELAASLGRKKKKKENKLGKRKRRHKERKYCLRSRPPLGFIHFNTPAREARKQSTPYVQALSFRLSRMRLSSDHFLLSGTILPPAMWSAYCIRCGCFDLISLTVLFFSSLFFFSRFLIFFFLCQGRLTPYMLVLTKPLQHLVETKRPSRLPAKMSRETKQTRPSKFKQRRREEKIFCARSPALHCATLSVNIAREKGASTFGAFGLFVFLPVFPLRRFALSSIRKCLFLFSSFLLFFSLFFISLSFFFSLPFSLSSF